MRKTSLFNVTALKRASTAVSIGRSGRCCDGHRRRCACRRTHSGRDGCFGGPDGRRSRRGRPRSCGRRAYRRRRCGCGRRHGASSCAAVSTLYARRDEVQTDFSWRASSALAPRPPMTTPATVGQMPLPRPTSWPSTPPARAPRAPVARPCSLLSKWFAILPRVPSSEASRSRWRRWCLSSS